MTARGAKRRSARVGGWLSSWLVAIGLGTAACSPPARPPVMARVAEVRSSPAAAEAETWAPQAHAHALELEERAERSLRDGDAEAASLLAEQALAAHEHAWALTRLARAERRRLDAQAELDEQRRVLGELRAQHQRLAAEAAALELRSQVARSALPLPPNEASAPERIAARRRAAGALSAQARLLCVSARLLGERERVEPLIARLDELDRQLAADGRAKTLEAATDLRADCLRVISEVRRQNTAPGARGAATPPPGAAPPPAASNAASNPAAVAVPSARTASGPVPADVLLDELSVAGAMPARDDRGVAVSLRELLAPDGSLTAAARAEIQKLGRVAGQHPDFPLLLVGHTDSPRGSADVERQLAALRTELVGSGVSKVETWSVGDSEPLLPARSPTARLRNQRIELVFVAPGF